VRFSTEPVDNLWASDVENLVSKQDPEGDPGRAQELSSDPSEDREDPPSYPVIVA